MGIYSGTDSDRSRAIQVESAVVVRPNYALQRTLDAPTRGALRRASYFAPSRAVISQYAAAERDR
jgi:hypothetical protein